MTSGPNLDAERPELAEPGRYDAFLSYARVDADFVIGFLVDALRTRNHEVWIDIDMTGGTDWRDRIRRGIDACNAFIFVISPASLASEVCQQELEDAVSLNKLIIPVVYQQTDDAPLPKPLADTEWIFFRVTDDRDRALDRLVEALETDVEWRDKHTRLAGRAREWLDADNDKSYLLRGADLRDAELWLARSDGQTVAPTTDHRTYIARSRQASVRRLYTLIAFLIGGLVIAIALTIFAFEQRDQARRETQTATSSGLGATAEALIPERLDAALVLSLAALAPYRQALTATSPAAAQVSMANALLAARVHDLATILHGSDVHDEPILRVAFSPDGRMLAALSLDGGLDLWDTGTHRRLATLRTGGGGSFAFSPYGRSLAATSSHGKVDIWGTATHVRLAALPTRGAYSLAFSPDGRTLAVAGFGTVSLWNIGTNRRFASVALAVGTRDAVLGVAFSHGGHTVAAAAAPLPGRQPPRAGTVYVWDTATRPQISSFPIAPGVDSVGFNHAGRTVAVGTKNGIVYLWNTATHTRTLSLPVGPSIAAGVPDAVWSVVFSRDGRKLAAGTESGTVDVWNTATHAQIASLSAGTGLAGLNDVDSVAFSPDGRMLAAGTQDGTVYVWNIAAPAQYLYTTNFDYLRTEVCRLVPDGISQFTWHQVARGMRYENYCT